MNSQPGTAKPKRIGKSAAGKRPTSAAHPDKPTPDDFDQEGLGIASKE